MEKEQREQKEKELLEQQQLEEQRQRKEYEDNLVIEADYQPTSFKLDRIEETDLKQWNNMKIFERDQKIDMLSLKELDTLN